MGHDLCIAMAALGAGWLACAVRMGVISKSDRRRAKAYLDRCRAKAAQAERVVNGGIGHLTLVVGQKLSRRFGRRMDSLERRVIEMRGDIEQLQRVAFAGWSADGSEVAAMELDEPSTLALRREGTNGCAG